MSTSEPPADAGPAAETAGASSGEPRLTATDVRSYATLGWASIPVAALVNHPLMWLPAAVLYLLVRGRDQAGLLRLHLGQAVSFSSVMTIYTMVLHYALDAAGAHGRLLALYPVLVALAVAFPCVRAVQAARRLEPYTAPEALAWIPLERD